MPGRSFEQWINCIFDHPVTEPAWYWDLEADTGVEPDDVNVAYLARLFSDCDHILNPFDNSQVDQGLNMIAHTACSDHAYCITGGPAPWPARQAAIRAIFDLYAKCFSRRCSEGLSHLDEVSNPLNCICYMWWDLLPCRSEKALEASSAPEVAEYFSVLERCLTISHQACIEGTLHGLGHWHPYFPERVEGIINGFLGSHGDLRPELVEYARCAQIGGI